MKTISRRICGVVLGLGVLGSIVHVVRADDAYSQWQQWREEQRRQQDAQAERERQDERAAWHTWLEGTYRQREEWYEWEAWVSTGGWNSTEAQVVRPAGLVILNPFALAKMAPADQEKSAPAGDAIGPANPGRATDRSEPIRARSKVAGRSGAALAFE